jgi:hypothetical protein
MSSINANFEREMVAFAEAGKQALQDMTKMILVEISVRLVNRSPVGDPPSWKHQPPHIPRNYLPGTFKNNWSLGVDAVNPDIFFAQDPSGANSITRIALAIPRWPVGHTYFFCNNLPYAQALEDGWSHKQAPNGMVSLTMSEFQNIVEQVEVRYAGGERPVNKGVPK